jgi:hypothetical protein
MLDSMTKTWRRVFIVAFVVGFILQVAVPASLFLLGSVRAALWSMFPGLYPMLLTRRWFAAVTPVSYVLVCVINTAAYGAPVFGVLMAIRRCGARNLSHS